MAKVTEKASLWLLLLTAVVVTGCQPSALQEYVSDHGEYSGVFGDDQITILAENESDLDSDVISDLVWVQTHMSNTILPDDNGLKHITVFLPDTEESFTEARNCLAGMKPGVISMAFTTPARKIVVFNPTTWRDLSRDDVVETYIHELMHYVAYKLDGDMDASHLKSAYWGKNGLVSIILKEWKEFIKSNKTIDE